jgi:hypothetical protein
VTAIHKRIAMRLREIRNDTIWINGEDVAMAFKPMKMGLRLANLMEGTWEDFLEKYMRIKSTYEELYNLPRSDMQDEDIKVDIEHLKMLYSICKEKKLVRDTVVLLN